MPSSKLFTEPGALATLESLLELGSPAHPDLLQMGLLMRSPGDLYAPWSLKFEKKCSSVGDTGAETYIILKEQVRIKTKKKKKNVGTYLDYAWIK